MKADVSVAKNCLFMDELQELNEIVTMYLDYGRHIPMTMADGTSRLDAFLQFSDAEILQDKGKVTAAIAKAFAESKFEQYCGQAMVPYLETTVLNLIQSSCANLTRDVTVSALTGALESFANVEIPEHDLPAEPSELTKEESAQLTAQLTAELTEAAEDPQNWQQRMMAVIQAWKVRNPIVAGFVQLIVTTVISQLIWESLCWGAATLRDSVIREEPTSKAAVVCQIKQGETITVIGDAPYYYLVEITDPDTDECFSGYISKKSVRPTQSEGE